MCPAAEDKTRVMAMPDITPPKERKKRRYRGVGKEGKTTISKDTFVGARI